MNPTYEIVVKITTPNGLTDVGVYSLGANLDFALSIFNSLKGEYDDNDDAIIRLCLIEKNGKIPPKQLISVGCILDEFAANSRIIIRDVFKLRNLEKRPNSNTRSNYESETAAQYLR